MIKRKILINVTKFFVTFSILYFLVTSDRLNFETLMLYKESFWLFFFLFFIIVFWCLPITAFRWWLLLKSIRVQFSLLNAYILTWVGYFFNLILPGAISGDIAKGYYIIKANKNRGKTEVLMTLLIDRFIGLFGLVFLSFIGLLLNLKYFLESPILKSLGLIIMGLFISMVVFIILIIFQFKKIQNPFIKFLELLPGHKFLFKFYRALKHYQHKKRILFIALLLSIMSHSGNLFIIHKISYLFEINNIEWHLLLSIIPLGLITTAIPLAPAGIGVGHVAFASLYDIIGNHNGADIFNLYVILYIVFYSLGGISYLIYKGENSKLYP
jgi:uncharacterized protein (TIRG00374 family)